MSPRYERGPVVLPDPKPLDPLTSEDVADLKSDDRWEGWWNNRWPEVELYHCLDPRCRRVEVEVHFCKKHHPDGLAPFYDLGKHLELRVDDEWIRIDHAVIGKRVSRVSHLDGNPVNNRPENLRYLSYSDAKRVYVLEHSLWKDAERAVHPTDPNSLDLLPNRARLIFQEKLADEADPEKVTMWPVSKS